MFTPMTRYEWQQQATCTGAAVDKDWWHHDIPRAKQICNRICPVRIQCLKQALADDERDGVWGGMTVLERDRFSGRTFRRRLPEPERPRCLAGHEYTPENTYLARDKARVCRICRKEKRRLKELSR